jgi:hypothetical protein
MLALKSHTVIDGGNRWAFDALASCTIVEDVASLTDTCTIELPKRISWQGRPVGAGDNPPIRRGDGISVSLGYDGDPPQRFSGYVRRVAAGTPVRIECEDGMFLLKTAETKKKSFRSVTLDALVSEILTGSGVRHALVDKDVVLGPYRITQDTVARELAEMQREFGLLAYFRDLDGRQRLYVGYTYPFDGRRTGRFIWGKNIIEDGLEYRLREDIKLQVKAISILQKGNRRIEETVGDRDGELRTVYRYNIDKKELKVFAAAELERFKYSGYQGSITAFGEPAVRKTDIAYVEGQDGNRGSYLIKKVETTFGVDGYRQKIELGPVRQQSNG